MVTDGISLALARERAARVSALECDVRLSLPLASTAPVTGELVMRFELADASSPLVADFAPTGHGALRAAAINGVTLNTALTSGHLVVPSEALRTGANTLTCSFTASDAPLNRREQLLYSIFVPARAHEVLPCFDQPDLKARWSLTLELPADWTAVANAPAAEASEAVGTSASRRRVIVFERTPPLPAYLFAFAAGRLHEARGVRDGRTFRVYHDGTDSALIASNLDAIVDGHARALRWMETYTASAHPFAKCDIVLLPAFQFSGMEHPGAIFYNASALLLGTSATRQQHLARAHVIAHETAHLWFGDLVTMTWFDDVWMKEVFANFLAAKIVEPDFADLDHDLRFLLGHYPAAYDVDRTAGANPIRQALDNLRDAGSLYGAIVYLKSAIVMRQLEWLLGEDALRAALRAYLEQYRFSSASWPELCELLTQHTGVELARWSRDWIDEAGRPVLAATVTSHEHRVSGLRLVGSSRPAAAGEGTVTWPQRVTVTLGHGRVETHSDVWLDGTAEVTQAVGMPLPDYVLLNGRGVAYGESRLDVASRDWLLAHLPDVVSDVTRGSAWLALWDTMLAGRAAPAGLLDLAIRAIPGERSELNVQRMLSDVERLFWVLQRPDERRRVAADLEAALRDTLRRAPSTSAKAAIFATLRTLAVTDATVAWMRDLWEGSAAIEGLTLGEPEQVALAQELAIRLDEGDAVVRAQLARSRGSERGDALAFMAPALSVDPEERERFHRALGDASERRREPWVVEGLRWLHHPLRAADALPFLGPGLERLEDVKRTGDIFLPKRWLDAMLSGHQTREAAAIVHAFLETRPASYPASLRRQVLASSDLLFRAASRR